MRVRRRYAAKVDKRVFVQHCGGWLIAVVVSFGASVVACGSFGAAENAPAGVDASEGSTPAGPMGDSALPLVEGGVEPRPDAYGIAVLADKPIAYFRFEETSGESPKNEIPGSAVSALVSGSDVTLHVDGSSQNRHAVGLDAPTASVTVINAMNFTGEDEFTVEAWLQLGSPADVRIFSNMDNVGDNARVGQWLFLTNGALRSETWNGSGLILGADLANAPAQSWMHVVFLHSAAQQDVVYANAIPGTNYKQGIGARVAPQSPLSWTGFKGRLDELAIYNTALSPARIAAHYAAR